MGAPCGFPFANGSAHSAIDPARSLANSSERPSGDQPTTISEADKLHRDEIHLIVLANLIDMRNVRMIKRRCG